MTVLCGVAGSGKSSLAQIVASELIQREINVISISQKNIGISLRSTPLTYLDIFDDIRKLFARANSVSPRYLVTIQRALVRAAREKALSLMIW